MADPGPASPIRWWSGWSLGNEFDEIITAAETTNILAKGSTTAAKRALVDEALRSLYGGDVAKARRGVGREAVERGRRLRGRAASAPAGDVEALRQYYARAYYGWVYRTVKELDPNHLYFGFWIVPGWWENESDWDLGAEFVDVIGYDRYADRLADDWLNGYIARDGKARAVRRVQLSAALQPHARLPSVSGGERGRRRGGWDGIQAVGDGCGAPSLCGRRGVVSVSR